MEDSMMSRQGRGELTERIEQKSHEVLGHAVCQTELRFMAYVHYTLMNSRRIDPERIDADEVMLLNDWFRAGRMSTDKDNNLVCTKEFWDAMSEILYLGYVDLKEDESDG